MINAIGIVGVLTTIVGFIGMTAQSTEAGKGVAIAGLGLLMTFGALFGKLALGEDGDL